MKSERLVEVRTDANVQRVCTLICQDHRLTVRLLADELNMNRETVRQILIEDLRMKKLCTKMAPKNLLEEWKLNRMSVTEDCFQQVENDPKLLDQVITGNERCFFQYVPETKRQSI